MSWDRLRIDPKRLRQGSGTSLFLREDGTFAAAASTSPIVKVMSSTQNLSSTTTMTNVTDLVFTIGANETWAYQLSILAQHNATMGIKLHYTAPAGSTSWMEASVTMDSNDDIRGEVVGSTNNNGTPLDFLGTYPIFWNNSVVRCTMFVKTAGTAGSVQVQYAQSTSDGNNLQFMQGSFGIWHKTT